MRGALISSLVSLLFGCAPNGMPMMASDAGPPDAGDPDPASVVTMPELEGVSVLEDENPDPDVVEVSITAAPAMLTLDERIPPIMGYAYNGQSPGPAVHAKVGDELIVHFTNELPEPTTIHWHGMRVPDYMDGNPRIQTPVAPGETFTYRFVIPDAATFWYHPHVRSYEQVERGLYGPVIIRDADDPEYDAERVMMLDDIWVDPDTGELPPFLEIHPDLVHGRTGNMTLHNGHYSEDVGARAAVGQVERWRLTNTANATTFDLTLDNARFRVIGTDGGKLPEPYTVDRLTLPAAQRYDLEVTYESAGRAELRAHFETRDGDVALVMFGVDVEASTAPAREVVWPALPPLPTWTPDEDVVLELDSEVNHATGHVRHMLNGRENAHDPPLFTFTEGDVVRIRLSNRSFYHPFHMHGQFFQIVSDERPWTQQPGLKDTVLLPAATAGPGGSVIPTELDILVHMDNPGQWMAHCHILEHAALGMMSTIVVEHRDD